MTYNDFFSGKDVGSVSEVVQEGNQFKILKLTEIKEIQHYKVMEAIRHTILAKRKAQAVHEFAEKFKNENKIEVEILEEKE